MDKAEKKIIEAKTFIDNQDYTAAEPLIQQALTLLKDVLRFDINNLIPNNYTYKYTPCYQRLVTELLNILATIYAVVGAFKKAAELLKLILTINEQMTGLYSIDTVKTLSDLGYVYCLADDQNAESTLFQALDTLDMHNDVATHFIWPVQYRLANLFFEQHRYVEAMQLYLKIKERVGSNHPIFDNVSEILDKCIENAYQK
jgi:tetratricopeptide (TPR) repeat protein